MAKNKGKAHEGTKEFSAVTSELPHSGTKEFEAVSTEASALYSLQRPSSDNAATVCRKMQWQRLDNTLIVAYLVFAVILLIFSIYYAFKQEYLMLLLPLLALAFMVYTVLYGHNVFCKGMNGDESKAASTLVTEFYEDSFTVSFADKTETLSYSAIKDIRCKADYIYLQTKNSRHFSCGVLLLRGSFVENEADGFVAFIKNKIKE